VYGSRHANLNGDEVGLLKQKLADHVLQQTKGAAERLVLLATELPLAYITQIGQFVMSGLMSS
jgi:hypothetical protein